MTAPFFTIITPTLQRTSLITTCRMLDLQTFQDWTHIVVIDCEDWNEEILEKIRHPRRGLVKCERPHKNGGNTCRHSALDLAKGSWIIYCDDDNYLADENVLQDIHGELHAVGEEIKWALFPIIRLGSVFFTDPPRSCHVDTLNLVLRREVARWPDTDAYGTDGILVDDLIARKVPYVSFPSFRPIGIIPVISFCQ